MDADSEATADMDEAEAPGDAAARPRLDYEADEDDDGALTESDGEQKALAAVQAHSAMRASKPPNRRSRASSPDWMEPPTLEDRRLTARQRARLEKEAGLAEDVQWHEMAMPPELAYTWKGKGNKVPSQMTEEEWLKRQEGLERRRMRSLRDKREAEETIKAKLRKAVTVKFRGKLGTAGGDGSGTEGEAAGGTRGAAGQESLVQPGWVKVRHTVDGYSIAWHANAHPLSYPMAVATSDSYPLDPVELPLQRPTAAEQWRIPDASSNSFRLGCTLVLQQQQQQLDAGMEQQQQLLWCVDNHGWAVGCLQVQKMLDALDGAGYDPAVLQQQLHNQQQQQAAMHQALYDPGGDLAVAAAAVAAGGIVQGWQVVVKTLKRSQADPVCLKGVVVRLLPIGGLG
ncbi:hypothetical protein COO60DRAFT_1476531 [Scenedesmus sp. NREL 46B-D3]|nr:hypothetical protein COO60DRAFT_1476531 [Scenedesmus sp. NREL 46B-D3]